MSNPFFKRTSQFFTPIYNFLPPGECTWLQLPRCNAPVPAESLTANRRRRKRRKRRRRREFYSHLWDGRVRSSALVDLLLDTFSSGVRWMFAVIIYIIFGWLRPRLDPSSSIWFASQLMVLAAFIICLYLCSSFVLVTSCSKLGRFLGKKRHL